MGGSDKILGCVRERKDYQIMRKDIGAKVW